jgi:signal transduction histidine kinase
VQENILGEIDGPRLERVFSNLIHNAIKYAPQSPISIHLMATENEVLFSIEDGGPGIPSDKHQIIFEAFERVADKQIFTGLGLGLYICRQIVLAHKGSIFVESGSPRVGSLFKVALPMKRSTG